MDADRRRFLRFPAPLMVQAKREERDCLWGLVKDFSRNGLRVVFDELDFVPNSCVNLDIQMPNENVYVTANAEIIWKRFADGRWEAGLSLKEFPAYAKVEILEHGYNKWVAEREKEAAAA